MACAIIITQGKENHNSNKMVEKEVLTMDMEMKKETDIFVTDMESDLRCFTAVV